MCRYSWHNYRDHFACFDCRKAFKYWQWEATDEPAFRSKQRLRHVPRKIICPDCSAPMIDMGLDFKAPPKADGEAWEVLRKLAQNEFTFFDCGCGVGFVPPKTLREVPHWLATNKSKTKGEKLLEKIERLSKARRENRKPEIEKKIRIIR